MIIIITSLSALLSLDCNKNLVFVFVCLFVCFSLTMESNCYLPC